MIHRSLLLLLVGMLFTGCEESLGSKLNRTVDAPPPRHPAMRSETDVGRSSSSIAMPAGHPPVGGQQSTSSVSTPSSGTGTMGTAATGTAAKKIPVGEDGRMIVGSISFLVPEGWVNEAPASAFRSAQFSLSGGDNSSDVGLMTVSMAGGDVQANLSRWQGFFQGQPEVESDTRNIGGLQVSVVRMKGDYQGMTEARGGGGSLMKSYMLMGAVIPIPGSRQSLFFKGTGPRATMEKWSESFETLIASLILIK